MNSREIVEKLIEIHETRLQRAIAGEVVQDLPSMVQAYATLLLARRAVT